MAEVLRPEQVCAHDSGVITMMADSGPLCGDCQTPMVWVSQAYLVSLARTPSEVEAHLRRENQRLRGVLDAIQHSIEQIARMSVPK